MPVNSATLSRDEVTREMLTQCAAYRVRRRWNPHLGRTGGWDIESSGTAPQPYTRLWALTILATTGMIVWVEAGECHWSAEPTEYGLEVLAQGDTTRLGDAA
jgi:hypothetical protein